MKKPDPGQEQPSQEQAGARDDRRLVAGRYRLHAQIGRGRLGDIYEADDEGYRELGVGGRVALQLLPDRIALDQGLLGKLKLGFKVLHAGSHPNLVSYYDCGYDGKYGYVAMELLDGASLRFVIEDHSTLPLEEAFPVVRAVGDALQFLHAKSMVHGRVSAENVFVTGNLEIRLLDIVPLDSPSAVLRDGAPRDRFSRVSIGDDVHALACLTYELLAGKHPFNFHPAAEARQAGLEPARIPSLPEQQWNALQRALSFDADVRPASVRAFFDDFGVTGIERLRPSNHASPVNRPPPRTRKPAMPAPAARPVTAATAPRTTVRRKRAGTTRKPAGLIRPFVLLSVLAGICAWYFLGQPGNDIARLIAFAESYVDPAAEDGAVPVAPAGPAEPAPAVPAEAAASAPVTESPPQTDQDAEAASGVAAPAAAGEAPAVAAAAEPETEVTAQDETAARDEIAAQNETAARDETAAQEDLPATADAALSAADSRPGNVLVRSLVTVSERDGAARVAFRRPLGTTGALFWWTGDDTAVGEEDYIALEQPFVAFESGEEAETLHVPLINDSLPEPLETFYVFLGQRDAVSGRLEPVARVRVDINDDD